MRLLSLRSGARESEDGARYPRRVIEASRRTERPGRRGPPNTWYGGGRWIGGRAPSVWAAPAGRGRRRPKGLRSAGASSGCQNTQHGTDYTRHNRRNHECHHCIAAHDAIAHQAHHSAEHCSALEAVLGVADAPPAKDKSVECSGKEEAKDSVEVKVGRFSDTYRALDVAENKQRERFQLQNSCPHGLAVHAERAVRPRRGRCLVRYRISR